MNSIARLETTYAYNKQKVVIDVADLMNIVGYLRSNRHVSGWAHEDDKIAEISAKAHEAVMKERNDIATRATYLCLLACYQAGLSPRTLVRIQNYMTGPVADKYNEYRNDQLADLWAQVTLQGIGIDAKKTEEPL